MYKPFFVANTPTLYTKMEDTPIAITDTTLMQALLHETLRKLRRSRSKDVLAHQGHATKMAMMHSSKQNICSLLRTPRLCLRDRTTTGRRSLCNGWR